MFRSTMLQVKLTRDSIIMTMINEKQYFKHRTLTKVSCMFLNWLENWSICCYYTYIESLQIDRDKISEYSLIYEGAAPFSALKVYHHLVL